MYDLDYLLDGELSREHHQDMIREAQIENRAVADRFAQLKGAFTFPFRTLLPVLISLLVRSRLLQG